MSEKEQREITALLNTEKNSLWAQAMNLAPSGEDAEDLYQDTMLKAYRGFESFRPDTNFRAWIGKIMLNTHINSFNRNKKKQNVSCDFSSGECDGIAYHAPEGGSVMKSVSPERVFFSNYIDERLVENVYSMPESYRMPFALFHMEGFTYEEISEALEVPMGTVKSRIFRARKYLQEMLNREKVALN